MDHVARVSAPIPDGYTFDSDQSQTFRSPKKLDSKFYFKDIRAEYLQNVNRLLQQIYQACHMHVVCIENARGREVVEQADVLLVQLHVDYNVILMDVIAIRPCFAGYRLLLVVIYVLVKAACETGKTLVVQKCFPKMLAVLKRHFDGLVRYNDRISNPDCVFDNHRLMHATVTPSSLGIQDMIEENESGMVQLRLGAFPLAADLNDQAFVNAHFKHILSKHKDQIFDQAKRARN
jgi:hypothetical protein